MLQVQVVDTEEKARKNDRWNFGVVRDRRELQDGRRIPEGHTDLVRFGGQQKSRSWEVGIHRKLKITSETEVVWNRNKGDRSDFK